MRTSEWIDFLPDYVDRLAEVVRRVPSRSLNADEQEFIANPQSALSEGAAEGEIQAKENELQISLSASYRAFLSSSNGLLMIDMDGGAGRFLACNEIGWFRDLYPKEFQLLNDAGRIVSDEVYAIYGDRADPAILPLNYADHLLSISTFASQTTYLLNPALRFPDDECEAWSLNFQSGVYRYQSFSSLFMVECEAMLKAYRELL